MDNSTGYDPTSAAPLTPKSIQAMVGDTPATKSSVLTDSGVYNAVVTNFNVKDNTLTVLFDGSGLEEAGCVWGAGIFSGMLGFNMNYVPPIGTQVVVVKGSPSVVVGARSSFSGNSYLNKLNTATGEQELMAVGVSKETKEEGKKSFDQTGLPSDLLPGEFDLSNVYGVAVTLLSNLAKLSAGDLAKVECHLLNEMVRILSVNFKQHTAWGDIEFYNDGRLNLVINGTSYPHESAGLMSANEAKFKVDSSAGVDLNSIDAVNDTGRWRLAHYVGFLGNFIHTIITDPPSALGSIAKGVLQAGKAKIHVNNDGTILCQSVSEIVFERVTRIPVPRMKKRWEDASATKPSDFENLEKKFLKIWNEKSENIHHTAYQLREYARYLSLFHSYSRFLQLSQGGDKADYEVPSELDSPEPSRTNSESDVKQANSDVEEYSTYATFRIMRDGSIVIWDGYGSSVVMSHGDIQHSAVNNFSIEAAGDVRIVAGKNLYINAYRNIEIAAIVGGLKLKSRAWLHALCEWGSLLLKSDAKDPNDKEEEPDTPSDNDDPTPIVGDAAIILDATKGRTSVWSKNTIALEVTGAPPIDKKTKKPIKEKEDDYARSIVLTSKYQHIKMAAQKSIHAEAKRGMISLTASKTKSIILKSKDVFLDVTNFIVSDFANLGRMWSTIPKVLTNDIICHGHVKAAQNELGSPKHPGHIQKLSDKAREQFPTALRSQRWMETLFKDLDKQVADVQLVIAMEEKAFPRGEAGAVTFKFDDYNVYIPEPDKYELLQSPGQQFITLDYPDKETDYASYTTWSTMLKNAPRTNYLTAPFPGLGAETKVYYKGDNLRKPSARKPESFTPSDDKMKMTNSTYFFWRKK